MPDEPSSEVRAAVADALTPAALRSMRRRLSDSPYRCRTTSEILAEVEVAYRTQAITLSEYRAVARLLRGT